jgi:hypothetical protein
MNKKMMAVAVALLLAGAAASVEAGILIEAEAFAEKGGWSVDQQFVEQMGSPYLLAHGLGKPVQNAATKLTLAAAGDYRVWVRTKNWVPGDWQAPGRFKVLVNGQPLAPEFGTLTGWQWQDGGTVKLTAGEARLELQDLTGFDGRCDALYLTAEANDRPPDDLKQLREWRDRLAGLPALPPAAGQFDVVVVGGGISGCAAALAAAEQGLKVALIHDRPILGGNASGEVRVHTIGITGYATRLLKGINSDHWPNGSERALADDQKRQATMNAATNIAQFLGWRAYGVATNGNRIAHVNARHIETGEARAFPAPAFIDGTGDGWIGYWAGAEYRYGREPQTEFDEGWPQHGELWSPTNSDNRVMGTSLLWNSVAAATPQSFPEVPWAKAVAKTNSAIKGEWFWEFSRNDLDQIADAEEIRDHVLRAIYGSFANAKQNPKYVFYTLRFVGFVGGKRESRRLMGDYIYTFKDMTEGRTFADAVVTETREVDVHYQKNYKDPKVQQDYLSTALFKKTPRYYIPFRSLYSKNISNLMMAGRDFSCSHIGLGGPRVMNTCGQMGAATGYAAALMKKYGTTPRGVYQEHLEELLKLVRPAAAEAESTKPTRWPQIQVHGPGDELHRVRQQFPLESLPPLVREATCLIPPRGSSAKPAPGYRFTVNTPVEVWIAVHQRGKPALPAEWQKTQETLLWGDEGDVLFRRSFPAGVVTIPGHNGKAGGNFGLPHLTFVKPSGVAPAGGLVVSDVVGEEAPR